MEYGNDFEIGYSLNEVNFTNDLSDERFSNPEENLKEEENSQLTKNRTISSSAKSKFILDDFDVRKNKVLKDLEEEIDNSPKGSLDEPLIPLINLINKHPNYVTTSSCSGRVAIFSSKVSENEDIKRKGGGGSWLFVSHDFITFQQIETIIPKIGNETGLITFRFEPMVLHVDCRNLAEAQKLLQVAIASSFRESGIVAGKRRYMVGIRSNALRLEVPIATKGKQIVSENYLQFLVDLSNENMKLNISKITNFFSNFVEQLSNLEKNVDLSISSSQMSPNLPSDWAILVPPSICEIVRSILEEHQLLDSTRRNLKLNSKENQSESLIAIPILRSINFLSNSISDLQIIQLIQIYHLQIIQIPNLPKSKKKKK